jgi:hypothetical protein
MVFNHTLLTCSVLVAAFVSLVTYTRCSARSARPPRYLGVVFFRIASCRGRCWWSLPYAVGTMCCWISVKAVSLGVVVGLGRKLDKASASAGDGDAFGAVLLLGGVSFKPSSFSLSRHEDNFALPAMGTLFLGLRDCRFGPSRCRALATVDCAFIFEFKLST